MASLVTIKGPNPGQRFALQGDSLFIGRQEDAALYLDSLAVSRQHARLVCHGGEYFIEDIGSSNGTFVNGRRISRPTPLTEFPLYAKAGAVIPFNLRTATSSWWGVNEQTHPGRAAPEQPPDRHGQRAVVLAAVTVGDERRERVRGVARERQEQVVVADERRRREERRRHDDRDDDQQRAPRRHGHGRRWAIASARRMSSGVLRLTKQAPSGSRPRSSSPSSHVTAGPLSSS